MKNNRKVVNLFAVFIILIGGAFLVIPETSYAAMCTATVECDWGTCSCSGSNCSGSAGGCSASDRDGSSSSCNC